MKNLKRVKAALAVVVCLSTCLYFEIPSLADASLGDGAWVYFEYDPDIDIEDISYTPETTCTEYENSYDTDEYPEISTSYTYSYNLAYRYYQPDENYQTQYEGRMNYSIYSNNNEVVAFFSPLVTEDEYHSLNNSTNYGTNYRNILYFISLGDCGTEFGFKRSLYRADGVTSSSSVGSSGSASFIYEIDEEAVYYRKIECDYLTSAGISGVYSDDMNIFTSLESALRYLKDGTVDDNLIMGPDKPVTPKSDTTIGLSSFTCGNLITSGFEGKYGIVCNYAMAAQSFNPPASNPTLPRSLKVKFDITWTVDYVRYSSTNATRPIETITTTYYTTSWGPPIVNSAGNQIKFGCVESIRDTYGDFDAGLLKYFLDEATDNTETIGVIKTVGQTVISYIGAMYGQPAGGEACAQIYGLMIDSAKQADYYGIGNLTCYIKATPYDSATNSYGQYEACSLNAMTGVATTTSFGPTEVNNESYSYDSDPAESDYTKTDDTTYSVDGLGNIVISGGGGSSSSASNVTNVSFPDSITLKFGNALQVAGVSSGSSDNDSPDITIEDDDYTDTELRGDLSDGFGLLDDASTDQGKDGFLYSVLSLYDDFDPDIRKMLMFGTSSIVAIAIIQKIIRR